MFRQIGYKIDIQCGARDAVSRTGDGSSDVVGNPQFLKGSDYGIQGLKNNRRVHFRLRSRPAANLPASSGP